jgi:hypothetical protein
MVIDRRRFLAGLIGAVGATGFDAVAAEKPAAADLYAAARKGAGNRYSAAIFDGAGGEVNAVALPTRGHDVTVCPVTKRCVVFARRPGNFAVAFSPDRVRPPVAFTTPTDRHFYGHGVFSPDGRLLFATENDFAAGEGRLGIYDATDGFRRIGEFPAFGIDPHDIALLKDGATLVIANGGLATHPDFGTGREPLNLAGMDPSLSYVDLHRGELIEKHALPKDLHEVSLRHLDVGAGDRVVIGCQLAHPDRADMPLILRHRRGEEIAAVPVARATAASLRGYISSVAMDRAGEIAALTSSHGNLVVFIEAASGRVLGSRSLADVSGVAPGASPGSFLLTSGFGSIVSSASAGAVTGITATDWHWDNHAVRL